MFYAKLQTLCLSLSIVSDTYLDNQNSFISKKIQEKQLVLVGGVNFGCGPLLVTVLNQGL